MNDNGNEAFLESVDLTNINPPPNWTGFLIKNWRPPQSEDPSSFPEIKDGQVYVSDTLQGRFHAQVSRYPGGDLYVRVIDDKVKTEVLKFLRRLKTKQPQFEVVFMHEPKSPSIMGLIREGIKALLGS